MTLSIDHIRQDFPLLRQNNVVYLDSAATAQKPQAVLTAIQRFYTEQNANVHRGMHTLAEQATVAYEDARKTIASFIGASPQEIVFTKNCTEAINLVARSYGEQLSENDTVALSLLEHHSNIIPWLQLSTNRGAQTAWIDINDDGSLKMEELDRILAEGTVKLLAVTGLSNVLGVRTPIEEIIQKAHSTGATVLIDAAQLVVHERINVKDLDVDFLTFSGHKLYGPTGIGVLYAKRELLEAMPPFLGGGMMIGEVTTDHFTTADIPAKFEAGTQPIAEAIGLAAAIDWLHQFDWNDVTKHEEELMRYAITQLQTIDGLHILPQSPATNPQLPIGCLSFVINNVHPHDLTDLIGNTQPAICLRAGHHCAQPLHRRLGIAASTRLSLGIYNNTDDIDAAEKAIKDAVEMLKK